MSREPVNPGANQIYAGRLRSRLRQLMWSLQHLHKEGVNRGITNQFKKEQVLQTLQANGSQRWQSEEKLGKPCGRVTTITDILYNDLIIQTTLKVRDVNSKH